MMTKNDSRFLGIELGSTRIKAVVIDGSGTVLASGAFVWENKPLADDVWSYDLAAARSGLAAAYAACADDYVARHGARPSRFDAIGISAMMHGYLVFDGDGRQLAPFRTWRSTNAAKAGAALSSLFGIHLPNRWPVAQLYQSVLDGEEHVRRIAFQTTLAGYIHFLLTGRKVLGFNDASGMFPLDANTRTYDARLVELFREKTGLDVTAFFPEVLPAGADAGCLTEAGARFLDPSGTLEPGIPLCPPEGDVGTGLVATGTVRPGMGSASVGTSVFATVVLDRPIAKTAPHIDFSSTPDGKDVAMVHSNNGCGELDKWVALFGGNYGALLKEAMEKSDPDCGGVYATNWIAAEPLIGVDAPDPYLSHTPDAHLTRANIIRAQLNAVFATLAKGVEMLAAQGVRMTRFIGHGGLFKTPGVAQKVLADAIGIPVDCPVTAGEGGAWGIAVLAAYRAHVLAGGIMPLVDFIETVRH
ncbi:MAG: ATPase [Kiritimatiellae bacterium]|nr:ATPase [Kiritimatiellia bacterium]